MKITLELTKAEIELALKAFIEKEYNKTTTKISFNVSDTSDDRFGGGPSYSLVSASIEVTGNIR